MVISLPCAVVSTLVLQDSAPLFPNKIARLSEAVSTFPASKVGGAVLQGVSYIKRMSSSRNLIKLVDLEEYIYHSL